MTEHTSHQQNSTRLFLICGMVVGPFYLVVGLAQALLREGFDLGRCDARIRLRVGRMAFWLTALILVFVGIWMLIAGWLNPIPLTDFLNQRRAALIFVALWCTLGMAIDGFMREKGHRQLLEIERLGCEFER